MIAIGTESFTYDKVGRLKSATVRGPDLTTLQTQTYAYDPYGNLIETAKLGQTVSLPTDAATNRLASAGYDAAGNVTSWGTYHYDYDALGMMNTVRVGADPTPRVIYAYTADDERLLAFDVVTNATHWTLRGLDHKVLRDFKQNGTTWSVERDYIYRDGLLLAAMKPNNAVEHYSLDHLGTPHLVTDGAGNRIGRHAYWPFGEEWDGGNAQEGSPVKFTGHERDADPLNGANPLDYMHARYYRAVWGRFLAVDPAASGQPTNPQAWNRYAYAANNPLNYVDRNGQYYELASAADRQFYADAIALGTSNKAARELVERQAADPFRKIVLATGHLQGQFTYGDSSRLHGPLRTIAGNLFPAGITTTVDKGKLAMTRYPTPTVTVFHELKHDDVILNQGMAANARQPDSITLNVTTGQVTSNSIFEDFGRAAATSANDPMHALSADEVSKLIADPGEGKGKVVHPCESVLCMNKDQ